MDLEKAEKVKDLLYELDTEERRLSSISLSKGCVFSQSKDNEYVTVIVEGSEVKTSMELVLKFLEDVEREIRTKKVEILGELNEL